MKKHLEEDRSRLIQERDEQLVRATLEKRAWDALDPSEKERRLAKKARHSFLVGCWAPAWVGLICMKWRKFL